MSFYTLETFVSGLKMVKNLFTGETEYKVFPKEVDDDVVVDKKGELIPFECYEGINIKRNFSKKSFTQEEISEMSKEEIELAINQADSHDFLVENKSGGFHIAKNWNEKEIRGSLIKVNNNYYPLEGNAIRNRKLSPAAKYLQGMPLSMSEFYKLAPKAPWTDKIRKPALQVEAIKETRDDKGNIIRHEDLPAEEKLDRISQAAMLGATTAKKGQTHTYEEIAMGHIFKENNIEGREVLLRLPYEIKAKGLEITGFAPEGKREWQGRSVTESMYLKLDALKAEAKRGSETASILLELEVAKMQTDDDTLLREIQMKINFINYHNPELEDVGRKALRQLKVEESKDGYMTTSQIPFNFVWIKDIKLEDYAELDGRFGKWNVIVPNKKKGRNEFLLITKDDHPMVIGGRKWDIPREVLMEYAKYENDSDSTTQFKGTERNYTVGDAQEQIKDTAVMPDGTNPAETRDAELPVAQD